MGKKLKFGIYIHIPFCSCRCIYCGFYSTTLAKTMETGYVEALLHEIKLRKKEPLCFCGEGETPVVDTIYIGGGTPSCLKSENVGRILSCVNETYECQLREVTMEMNPDDITDEYVKDVKGYGVNRISMGIQSFDDSRLRFLRRRHTAEIARNAVSTVRRAGISNVSIDLMFGFPGQTVSEWQEDVRKGVELAPSHISAYSLMYEEGTPLFSLLEKGKVSQIADETSIEMYESLIDQLSSAGYEHYEISNFAKPEHRSLHNSSYWHDVPYLGFGASAHSYTIGKRSSNVSDIRQYVESLRTGILPSSMEIIDDDTHYDDLVTTVLRTKEGVYVDSLKPKYREYIMKAAKRNIDAGLMAMDNGHLHLTRKGLFVSDMVMCDLIYT